MTAPIRPEHREAAEGALRHCNFYDDGDCVHAITRVAQLLADTEAAHDADIAWLKAERDEEQSAHNAIGSVLAKAGCETPDGTSLGFARSAAANLAALSAEYADAVRALRACDAACLNESASAVLSTERALAVLKQGEATDV